MAKSPYKKRFEEQVKQEDDQQNKLMKDLSDANKMVGVLPIDKVGILTKIAFAANDVELKEIIAVAADKKEPEEARVLALGKISPAIGDRPGLLEYLISLLENVNESAGVRMQALEVLQQNSFRSAIFKRWQQPFIDALRKLINENNNALRNRALEILTQNKDEVAQRVLIEGLQDENKAVVPPETAIQFLGNDIHAEAFSVFRQIVNHPPNETAREEALKLLAADPASKDLLSQILVNKQESEEIRIIAASGLQNLDPELFAQTANAIIVDNTENPQVKAVCINALSQSEDYQQFQPDKLRTTVEGLREGSPVTQLKKAAENYLNNLRLTKNRPEHEQ